MIQIHNVEQNSTDWLKLRCGLPTASMFGAILAKGEGKTRRSYLNRLAAEIVTGEPTETYTNQFMERGRVMEDEARDLYAFMYDVDPMRVGFISNGRKGCSPDSLIGDDGALEIKTQRGDLLVETLLKDEFPSEHKAQCQGVLWVAKREWIDIAIFWPKMPLFIKRATRDEAYIVKLASEVNRFNEELQYLVEKIRRYGRQEIAA
ncbi:MAG: YqaJ viral recombinase family protein [Hyphomicrobiales bacterium]|nr:YqaJ viral recombinase family protein [Hyphomicrobiales bacterium]